MLWLKRDFCLQRNFEYFCRSVLMSQSASNSRVSEVSNFVFTSFMMSEAQWTAVGNVVLFSKPSIVIKLPVININFEFCSTSETKLSEFATCVTHYLSTLNQSIGWVLLALFNSKALKHETVSAVASMSQTHLSIHDKSNLPAVQFT